MKYTDGVVTKIKSLKKSGETLLIGIDGFGGSGKSTLAKDLKAELGQVSAVVSLDDFGYPADRKRLLEQVIVPLKNNNQAKYQRYDWESKTLKEWFTIEPSSIVIIEGLRALSPELKKYYDLTIWMDMDQEYASKRGLNRDLNEYKVDNASKWEHEWKSMEKDYVESDKPQETADFKIKSES